MTVPGNPYRCPPGPYERACMIAHFLKTKKPKSKLVIFDAKKTFSKQPAFEEAFAEILQGIIDLNLTNEIDDFQVVRVDRHDDGGFTKSGTKLKGAVANIIPPQRAGDIAVKAGCAEGDWCPIKPEQLRLRQGQGRVRAGRFSDCRRDAEVGVLGQQPGQGRGGRHPRRACRRRALPARLAQHLLVADRTPRTASRSAPTTPPAKRTARHSWRRASRSYRRRAKAAEVRKANYAESLAWYHAIIADAFNDTTAVSPKG